MSVPRGLPGGDLPGEVCLGGVLPTPPREQINNHYLSLRSVIRFLREIRGLKGLAGQSHKNNLDIGRSNAPSPLLGPVSFIYMQNSDPGSSTVTLGPAKPSNIHRNQLIVRGTHYTEPFYFIMLKAGISSREEKFARFVMPRTDLELTDTGIKLLTH